MEHISAQAPVVEWQRVYGGYYGEYAYSIAPTKDGGYIASGLTEGDDNGDIMGYHGTAIGQDFWVVKLDHEGKMQWQRCLGGTGHEVASFVQQTPDGGYIVAGSSTSSNCMATGNLGGLDYWLVKLTVSGEIEWQKNLGGTKNDYLLCLTVSADGGYIVAGDTESNNGDVSGNHGQRDLWVVKVDSKGNILWQKCVGGSRNEAAYSVSETPDGGCVAAGYTESNDADVSGNKGKRDYLVVKLSPAGDLQWQKCFGGTEIDDAWSVKYTKNGGIIVAGTSSSSDGDVTDTNFGSDAWIVKLNSNGVLEWQKTYGGEKNDLAYTLRETPDGGFLVSGSAASAGGDLTCNAGDSDMWVFKISATGLLQWQKSFGGNYADQAYCVEPTGDGGCIVSGMTCSPDIEGMHVNSGFTGSCGDFFIVKLSAPVAAPPPATLTIDPASATVCAGKAAVFTAQAKYAGIRPVYYWTKNGIAVGGNTSSYTASAVQHNDVISCTIINSNECGVASLFATDAITVKVNNSPPPQSIHISASQTVLCNCSTIRFTANLTNAGASAFYGWKVNGIAAGRNAPFFESSKLKSGDVITCEYADNLTCTANGFIQSNAITMTTATIAPAVTIAASKAAICSGEQVQFTATPVNAGTNPSYQWKVNGVNTGTNQPLFTTSGLTANDTVSCTITGDPSFTCSNILTALSNKIVLAIVGKTNPSVTVNPSATSICVGTTVTFSAKALNAGNNPVYQWNLNGVNTGNNDSVFTSNTLQNGDKVSCVLSVDPAYTCTNSNTATSSPVDIEVNTGTPASITITTLNNPVCEGKTVSFQAVATNAGTNPVYTWRINAVSAGGNSNTFSTAALKNGDQVSCMLMPGAGGCSATPVSSNSIVMNIYSLPAISILPVDTLVTPNSRVQFQTTVSEQPAAFSWSPPQLLQNPTLLSPQTIPLTDNSSFTLRVVTVNGCEAEAKVNVLIYRQLLMPNAFTPNGDGLNDVFAIPVNTPLQLIGFAVYNRWGQAVFSTSSIGKGWDGTFRGKPAEQGLYMYSIKGTNDQGSVHIKGTILLMR
jgi:gliding motility-associated-like protein